MSSEILLPWIVSIALLTVRLTVALALSPALSAYGVPVTVRVALTFTLATLTFAHRSPMAAAVAWVGDPPRLMMPVLAEVFMGALLGLGVQVVMAALALAGRLMDVQIGFAIGFAIGSVFDPVTRTSANVLGSMTALLDVTLFWVTGAHLQLAQMVSQSIDTFPLGGLPPLNDPLRPLLAAGSMFALGLAFAAPVVMALLLTDLAIGVASRNMPQINVLVLAIPVKVIVGYLVLALAVTGWAPLLSQGFDRMADMLDAR